MAYFNPKEDVLDIQLTPHGKLLFSQGKFSPKYYSFSDQDVLYNVNYSDPNSSRTETQNQANTRILEETPYTKIIPRINESSKDGDNVTYVENLFGYSSYGILGIDLTNELETFKVVSTLDNENKILNSINRSRSLGTLELGKQDAPKTKIAFLDGNLASVSNKLNQPTSNTRPDDTNYLELDIPQIEMDMLFKSTVVDSGRNSNILDGTDGVTTPLIPDEAISFPAFRDGGQILVESDQIVLLLEEENTYDQFESFEIEMYEVETDNNNLLRKLNYYKDLEDNTVSNNLMVSPTQNLRRPESLDSSPLAPGQFQESFGTVRDAGYYFEVLTDTYEEVSQELICSLVNELKTKDIAVDIGYECPDIVPVNTISSTLYERDKIISDKC